MCVIMFKPEGVAVPSREILMNCWDTNPDGFGMAVADGASVRISKGFMSRTDMLAEASKLKAEDAALLHFRIATSGRVDAGGCHPYPVATTTEELRAVDVEGLPYAVAHNGVISQGEKLLNDTQIWIRDNLSHEIGSQRDVLQAWLDSEAVKHRSRFSLLYADKTCLLAGDWTEKEGLKFSNMLWDWDYDRFRYSRFTVPTSDDYRLWGYDDYYTAIEDGFAPTCPECGAMSIAFLESMNNLCECPECGTVFNGDTGDEWCVMQISLPRKQSKSKGKAKAAYYTGR